MKVKTFYLVRHGIKERSIGDVSITIEGTRQAQLTGQYFSTLPITSIISSPLRRAIDTAQYISEASNHINIAIDPRLRERANWGDLPGQTFEQFVEMWDRCTREPDYIPPVGDSARQSCERLASVLTELVESDSTENNTVIVTHGGLITDYLTNTFSEIELNRFHPDFISHQSQLVPECSITELQYINGRLSIVRFASVEHLTGITRGI